MNFVYYSLGVLAVLNPILHSFIKINGLDISMMQETFSEGCIKISHSVVYSSSLHVHFDSDPGGVQCPKSDDHLWRLCFLVSPCPLLHTGGCGVDGS